MTFLNHLKYFKNINMIVQIVSLIIFSPHNGCKNLDRVMHNILIPFNHNVIFHHYGQNMLGVYGQNSS